ncbi:MAG TPA: hypothetical protein VN736_08600 [Candidatus Limnocylindrales bacterium]|nr:hypothetical protein [Candidatus Limnocylindrales bacterium]
MPYHRRKTRNRLFRKRWFADDSIIQCVSWYLRFKVSYRDLSEMMRQLGVAVAPSTILRWVIRYSTVFAESMLPFEKPVGRSWRCDETYITPQSIDFPILIHRLHTGDTAEAGGQMTPFVVWGFGGNSNDFSDGQLGLDRPLLNCLLAV